MDQPVSGAVAAAHTLRVLPSTPQVYSAQAGSQCLGIGDKATEQKCRALKGKQDCIKTPAFQSTNITASCIWHQVQTKRYVVISASSLTRLEKRRLTCPRLATFPPLRVKDTQTIRSHSGLPIGVTGLDYRGSLCALQARLQVPKQARSKWGAVAALRGGPMGATVLQGSTNPDLKMSMSSCQMSKGFPTSCKLQVAAPEGMNLDPNFIKNSMTVDFFTTNGRSIKSWMANQRLPSDANYDVRMEYTYTKCGVDKKNEPFNAGLPATSYNGALGAVGYNLFENYDRGWFSQDYKVFEVTNSTEVGWNFNVTKPMSRGATKQSLVTFMMTEADYVKWADKCIVCAAPIEYAMKGTLCEGTSCKVRRKYLGESGTYFIYVGFKDQVSNAFNDRSFSDSTSPKSIKSTNTKQAISVEVHPRYKFSKAAKAKRYETYGKAEDRAWVNDLSSRGILALGHDS